MARLIRKAEKEPFGGSFTFKKFSLSRQNRISQRKSQKKKENPSSIDLERRG
ncbi:hypothetical protein LEP1GSC161_1361 [Leptospira santarosai str. CBC1416]|uniref:Uncharacterized protein n=3 Tax=Leptospira santarosai TaxID=28183 RepID=M6UL34_9LEPT|nr:hypothetical protein LEP1GSC179_3196 [Leptospira santarosai str. MOR084]EKR93770.1 hypothetical protein LEP1GSC163_4051 [Leptospira santarosai str. CBC379]EMJ48845.1 hypothetical protein LEP1GSC169_1471 [Leptospira santarosai str. HAI1349]EMO22780.1 hypothetical protein LEP1GSC168_2001 [Leptospira santarosai str. HAI134]EMO45832.1 hypothetical protein LEP1GSC187_3559 [Leptospira santarosai str. ZUN179]EMO58414.1 hypothetical protein LEP1GSC161_1361 [Leptospira santarosai str. CBC1416]